MGLLLTNLSHFLSPKSDQNPPHDPLMNSNALNEFGGVYHLAFEIFDQLQQIGFQNIRVEVDDGSDETRILVTFSLRLHDTPFRLAVNTIDSFTREKGVLFPLINREVIDGKTVLICHLNLEPSIAYYGER